jgi:hypothetical protein
MRVLLFLFLFAGCETPAPKKDLTPGPPPVEGINIEDEDSYECSNYYESLSNQGQVCNGEGCEEMHK